jgi:hypothetical protein
MYKRTLSVMMVLLIVTGATVFLMAQPQTLPVLNQGTAGDRMVSGRAASDAGQLKVYDLTNSPRTSIEDGSTSMDSNGNFAVSVKPQLVQGHQIIVEDSRGRSSAPMTVKGVDAVAGRP